MNRPYALIDAAWQSARLHTSRHWTAGRCGTKFMLVKSRIGCSTCSNACWINRSATVGIPSSRLPPSGLGERHPSRRPWPIRPSQKLLPYHRAHQMVQPGPCPACPHLARDSHSTLPSTLGHPHAVALHLIRDDQLRAGLTPIGLCSCWSHLKKTHGSQPCVHSRPGIVWRAP